MNFIVKLIKISRYVLNAARADDCWRKKEYVKALKYTKRAENILPLSHNELLRRAHIHMRTKEFTLSIEDAKQAIKKIGDRKNYTKYDKDYLVYYASMIGIYAQCHRDKISPNGACKVFKAVRFEHLVLTEVSRHHLDNFSIKKLIDSKNITFNQ